MHPRTPHSWLIILATGLLLAGCSPDSPTPNSEATPVESQDVAHESATAGDTRSGPTQGPNLATGQPGQPEVDGPAAAVVSHDSLLASFAEAMGIDDPPEVGSVRVVTQDEWSAVLAQCLTDSGFPARVAPGGQLESPVFSSPEQMADYDRAYYVCLAQYPVDPRHSQVLTDPQLRIYYDWLLENPIACMRERGHPVNEPPTLETFMANYRANGELSFFADGLPPGQEAEIMSDVIEHCETEAPLDVLFED